MTTLTRDSTPQDTYNAIHARCIERIAQLEAARREAAETLDSALATGDMDLVKDALAALEAAAR